MQRRLDTWLSRRGVASAIALALVASACGGASSPEPVETSAASGTTQAVEASPTAPAETAPVETVPPETAVAEAAPAAPTPSTAPTPEPEPEPAVVGAQAAIELPSVDVVSLATGQTADLGSFAKPGPTLVWFWAPH